MQYQQRGETVAMSTQKCKRICFFNYYLFSKSSEKHRVKNKTKQNYYIDRCVDCMVEQLIIIVAVQQEYHRLTFCLGPFCVVFACSSCACVDFFSDTHFLPQTKNHMRGQLATLNCHKVSVR